MLDKIHGKKVDTTRTCHVQGPMCNTHIHIHTHTHTHTHARTHARTHASKQARTLARTKNCYVTVLEGAFNSTSGLFVNFLFIKWRKRNTTITNSLGVHRKQALPLGWIYDFLIGGSNSHRGVRFVNLPDNLIFFVIFS